MISSGFSLRGPWTSWITSPAEPLRVIWILHGLAAQITLPGTWELITAYTYADALAITAPASIQPSAAHLIFISGLFVWLACWLACLAGRGS